MQTVAMVSGDRQRIIENNRSLRTIKNELESLLEKGVLTDSAYDNIMSLLPVESSLSSSAISTVSIVSATPNLPIRKADAPLAPATEKISHPPPAYSQSRSQSQPTPVTAATVSPMPGLPPRKTPQPAAPAAVPPPPEKPVLCKVRAVYKYAAQDIRDCSFDKDDVMHVYEYTNADWWFGCNSRTGTEGIFPRNYVQQISSAADEKSAGGWGNEKAGETVANTVASSNSTGGYPAPPPPGVGNPYNSDTPPMSVADGDNDKHKDMGKKFGKKLGNAAIFGAGATMGSQIVSSIF